MLSQERIIFLDPRGRLGSLPEALSRPGLPVETLTRAADLLTLLEKADGATEALVVLLDGTRESGLEPELAARVAELAPEPLPILIALVGDRPRGRAWTLAGAASCMVHPFEAEDLRSEVERWFRFTDRLRLSGRREETLRKFFAMFAHDLKNPLNAISGYCELALSHPSLPAQARDDLEKALRNADLLSTMAQGLVEMVRGLTGLQVAPRESEPVKVVTEAVEMMRVRAQAQGISIRVRAEGPPAVVRVDPARFIEALGNVLDNAIRFSPPGSTIDVGISTAGPDALVTIEDEGPGIPASDREQIFERSARPRPAGHHGGLGLGLSIAREIIRLHRGTIAAEARTPRGTRIAIRVPCISAGLPGAQSVPTGAAQAPSSEGSP